MRAWVLPVVLVLLAGVGCCAHLRQVPKPEVRIIVVPRPPPPTPCFDPTLPACGGEPFSNLKDT